MLLIAILVVDNFCLLCGLLQNVIFVQENWCFSVCSVFFGGWSEITPILDKNNPLMGIFFTKFLDGKKVR